MIIAGQSKRMRAQLLGRRAAGGRRCCPWAAVIGSPTYGTDKTANAQLASDVTGILSLGPKQQAADRLQAAPGAGEAGTGEKESLPAPQDNVAAASNPDWPESPEQMRARLRAEATANQDNPNYRSPIVADVALNEQQEHPVGDRRCQSRRGFRHQ